MRTKLAQLLFGSALIILAFALAFMLAPRASAATILITNSSDTLTTFRTNVNTSLTNLNQALYSYPFPSDATSTKLTLSAGLSTTYASTTVLSGTALCISTDCRTSWPSSFSYPFPSNATSTSLTFNGGLTASNATITYASTTAFSSAYASSTVGKFGSLSVGAFSGLLLASAGSVSAYNGANCIGNGFIRSFFSNGSLTCNVVALDADVSGTLPIANGGTNATAFTTSGNAVYYDGTKLSTAPTSGPLTIPYASSTALSATTLCLSADCRTSWPSGSSFAYPFPSNATSTPLTISYASSTALTVSGTSYLGTVASGIWNGTTIAVANGGTSGTTFTAGNVLYGNGTGVFGTVATGTVSGTNGVTATASRYVLGGSLTIDCTVATKTVAGCLAAADFNTFNNKIGTSSALTNGQLLVAGPGGNTSYSIATSAASCGAGISCGTFVVVGSGGSTITFAPSTVAPTTITYASTTALTVSGALFIPQSASSTLRTTGQVAVQTGSASSSVQYYDGTNQRGLYALTPGGLSIINPAGSAATSTVLIGTGPRGRTLTQVYCQSSGGTFTGVIGTGSATTSYTQSSAFGTTPTITALSTNNDYEAFRTLYAQFGSWSQSAATTTATCTWSGYYRN